MTESQTLFHAAVALLLLGVLTHVPALMGRMGWKGLAALAVGSLLPSADVVLSFIVSSDRIAALARPALLSGLLYGLLVIAAAAIVIAFWRDVRAGVEGFTLFALGFLFQMLLAALTPAGATPWSPVSDDVVSLAILPNSHLPLLVLLVASLIALQTLHAWKKPLLVATAVLGAGYVLVGAGQSSWLYYQASAIAPPGVLVNVEPSGAWMGAWQVTIAKDNEYEIRHQGLFPDQLTEPDRISRWNDGATLARLLGDPVVRHFYFRKFRHPVARAEVKDTGITLRLYELADFMPTRPGPTLTFEIDLPDQSRVYRVEHFD